MPEQRYVTRARVRPVGRAEQKIEGTVEQTLAHVKSALEMGAEMVRVDVCKCGTEYCCHAHDKHASPHIGCILR